MLGKRDKAHDDKEVKMSSTKSLAMLPEFFEAPGVFNHPNSPSNNLIFYFFIYEL